MRRFVVGVRAAWRPIFRQGGVRKGTRSLSLLARTPFLLSSRRSAGSRSFCEEATWVVPEVEDLLKEVKMEQYADKFSSLQEFIDVSSFELKTKKDIDTIKHRKLILRQSEIARQLHKLGVINETPRPEPEKEEEEDQTEAVEDGGDADDSMPAKGEEDKI